MTSIVNYIETIQDAGHWYNHPATIFIIFILLMLLATTSLIAFLNKKKLQKLTEEKIKELNEKAYILQASEAKYRNIFESAAEGILIADIETTQFVSANPAICRMLGYTEEELLTLFVSDIHPAESLDYVLDRFKAQAEGKIKLAPNIPCLRKDHKVILTNVCTSSVLFNNKIHNIGFFSDISETKQLTEEHSRLTAAIEQTHEVVVITDINGDIQYVNPAFEKVSGYTKKEALGQNPRINKGIGQSGAYYKQMWETISSGNVWTGKFYNKKKDGSEYEEEATISPVRNSDGKIVSYVAVKRDITHEVELKSQLRQAQKMEAIGLLAGGLAHDFNNILQTIGGYVDIVLNDDNLPKSHKNDLQEVKHAYDLASDLTARILSFSRQQAINPVNLNFHNLVDNIAKMLRRIIGENITLKISHDDPSHGRALADPTQIEQALMNLCINARDAMPDGGTITISINSIIPDEAHKPNLILEKNNRCLLLEVSDTGIGMSKTTQEKIFEPFFTTKEPGKGTGLGLASTYGIIKQHKGDIQVHSELGKGTIFSIYLPEIDAVEPAPIQKNIDKGILIGTETILVAEDNTDVRNFVERILSSVGYTVISAVDGKEAIDIFDANKDKIDFALLDIIMPKINGYKVREYMQKHNTKIKFLFTCGYTDEAIPSPLQSEDEYELLAKPYNPYDLLERIRTIIDSI